MRPHPRSPASRSGIVLFCAVLLWRGAGAPVIAGPGAGDPAENAALHYWKAAALVQQPRTPAEMEIAAFASGLLEGLPPRVFLVQPEALRWLLNERPMLAALDAGSRLPVCAFPVYREEEPAPDLGHLASLRLVAARARAAAKAFEHADNAEGAALIHAGLLRMLRHLDQDGAIQSGLVACELLQEVLADLASFLGRDQPRSAVAPLAAVFVESATTRLHPSSYLETEARHYGDWLVASLPTVEGKLGRLYGNSRHKPAVEKLATLDETRKSERLQEWVANYRARMAALAKNLELPYAQGVGVIREMDRKKIMLQKDPTGGSNPLVPLLVPRAFEMYQRFLLAQAQFACAEILCTAALYRAEHGAWPPSLDELALYAQRTFPPDPFGGTPLHYRLADDAPRLIIRVPRWIASNRSLLYDVFLADISRTDDRNLREFIRDLDSKNAAARRQAAAPATRK
jgi:hypothetical protein